MKTKPVFGLCVEAVSCGIKSLCLLWVALIFFGGLLATIPAQAQEADSDDLSGNLSKGIAKKLTQKVVPPLLAGNDKEFQVQLAALISRTDPEAFEQIETFGQNEYARSLKKAFYNAWRTDVSRGSVPANLKMRMQVALYLASATTQKIEEFSEEIKAHDLMTTTTLPEDWVESRNFFLDVESLVGRMSDLETMGHFVNSTLKPYSKPGKLKPEAAKILEGFQAAGKSFAMMSKETAEKEAVLRLQRLNAAAESLLKPAGDFEKNFVSALFFEEDVAALDSFFKTAKSPDAEELKQPDIVETTKNTISKVRGSGNPTIEKAGLLSMGLHQWKRGRYGFGALGNGLLKSLKDQDSRTRLPVEANVCPRRMPANPTAISQYLGEDSGMGYDRRHYYTWDLETRNLLVNSRSSTDDSIDRSFTPTSEARSEELICSNGQPFTRISQDFEVQTTTTEVTRSSTDRDFEGQDNSIPPRIVGTQEYSSAIENLERLGAISSEDEIKVYDKVIAQLSEFVFYSGMTAGVEKPKPLAGNQPINIATAKPQDIAESQFKKQSLAWLLALAKVELNSTRSMYIAGDKMFIPDTQSKFGLLEYYHVLLDDAAAHIQAISTDDKLKKALRNASKVANSGTIAYLRRLKLVSSMLVALKQSGDPMIASKSAKYLKEIEKYNLLLETQVALSTQDSSQTVTNVDVGPKVQTEQVINRVHR